MLLHFVKLVAVGSAAKYCPVIYKCGLQLPNYVVEFRVLSLERREMSLLLCFLVDLVVLLFKSNFTGGITRKDCRWWFKR